ncbi:hypothetical protein GHC57_18030 [Roseospira navarrensis]|uniref:Uncharacterized protein n=1 Tax=Roseospira navarrensis TaxID=140058 RepID=A0A7X1ZI73_9PROT|nr:hypothetical protein [Roseospira navarrensis]
MSFGSLFGFETTRDRNRAKQVVCQMGLGSENAAESGRWRTGAARGGDDRLIDTAGFRSNFSHLIDW